MQPTKIIITGGHVTPALAVIDLIEDKFPETEIVFVGRKYNNNKERTESFEYKEIQRRSIRFYHLVTGRFTRTISLRTLQDIIMIPFGFYRAWQILRSEKPELVLSFGGYLAYPVAAVASTMKIPVYTHEQTIHPGLANRKIGRIAAKVFISFPESAGFFPKSKAILTGNPVRKSVFTAKTTIPTPSGIPCVYVTGGSLGAHAINKHIEQILPELLKGCSVIHQTGNLREYNDYERLKAVRESLPEDLRQRYTVRTHIGDDEIGALLRKADVVVSRSGANTFFELVALKKPAVLIPLPLAAFDEQRKHAGILKTAGAAEIFEQEGKSEDLLSLIMSVLHNKEHYERAYQKLEGTYITEAAERIVEEIYRENRT
ncbi:UDP-N-acetylglucosamine--N-acetylmuramyl-(pentapeptide) pyrophosphoryl-undecaprenol N-acetylglucosamine transferase [Candidatus Roizmanbacteria bacterium]|nr:MAG: UDP-N-acetylglucosamine--N-acetylmuramyl-(pentapeptide) pyrophosphoryl-undecaprenol N-acetylglucosamine transferase [Candidatus Roizmanbacteria bacterium]